ncbi:MAG TPA: hypothetical protein VH142_14460 [Polyangiaceae bacterium]|jgi:hypothetical protein|nr:hypothetical protein [Polyangiaceae bacterium]
MAALAPAAAHAEDDSAADVAAARSLAVDGVKLAQSGHCDDAIDKLERAEKLHHSAIVLEHLGECYVTQGRLVDGTEALRKVLREPMPPDASATLKKAYEHAQTVLDAAKPKIAALTISVNVGADAHPAVTVDGEAVPPALIGADRPTDPGDHVVEATATGYLKASSHVSVGPGEKQSVSLELDVDPEAAKAAAAAQEATPVVPPAGPTPGAESPATSSVLGSSQTGAPPSSPNHVAAYVSWGIGAAAIGVGTVFGILAMNGKSKLDSQCTGNTCPPDASDRLDSSKRDGNIATIGFSVGAVGAVLGTVLFFTVGQGSHGVADSASSKPAPGTFSVGSRGTNFALQF